MFFSRHFSTLWQFFIAGTTQNLVWWQKSGNKNQVCIPRPQQGVGCSHSYSSVRFLPFLNSAKSCYNSLKIRLFLLQMGHQLTMCNVQMGMKHLNVTNWAQRHRCWICVGWLDCRCCLIHFLWHLSQTTNVCTWTLNSLSMACIVVNCTAQNQKKKKKQFQNCHIMCLGSAPAPLLVQGRASNTD